MIVWILAHLYFLSTVFLKEIICTLDNISLIYFFRIIFFSYLVLFPYMFLLNTFKKKIWFWLWLFIILGWFIPLDFRPFKYDYFKVWLHLSYNCNLAVLIFNYLTTQIHVLINIPVSNILFNPSLKFLNLLFRLVNSYYSTVAS